MTQTTLIEELTRCREGLRVLRKRAGTFLIHGQCMLHEEADEFCDHCEAEWRLLRAIDAAEELLRE